MVELKKEEENVLMQKLIRNLLNDSRTNSWEKDFLASVSSQLIGRGLSQKQINILNKIKQKCSK